MKTFSIAVAVVAVLSALPFGCKTHSSDVGRRYNIDYAAEEPRVPSIVAKCLQDTIGLEEILDIRSFVWDERGTNVWVGITGSFYTPTHFEALTHSTWLVHLCRTSGRWKNPEVYMFHYSGDQLWTMPSLLAWFAKPDYEREGYVVKIDGMATQGEIAVHNTLPQEKQFENMKEIVALFDAKGKRWQDLTDLGRNIFNHYKELGAGERDRDSWNFPIAKRYEQKLRDFLGDVWRIDSIVFNRRDSASYIGGIYFSLHNETDNFIVYLFERDIPEEAIAACERTLDENSESYYPAQGIRIHKMNNPSSNLTEEELFGDWLKDFGEVSTNDSKHVSKGGESP